jgi:hypothetical protein
MIERAKPEREKLLDQNEKSHRITQHSRQVIAQIDKALSSLREL